MNEIQIMKEIAKLQDQINSLKTIEILGGDMGVSIRDGIVTNRLAAVSQNRALYTESMVRLIGTQFDGNTIDPRFWTAAVTNSATITQLGKAILKTNTTADAQAKLNTVRKARFVPSYPMEFKAVCTWATAGDADNIRQIGAYDTNNGFFFSLSETTFAICSRTNVSGSAVTTTVSSGSFNGDVSTYAPGTTRHSVSIQYTAKQVAFLIDGVLIHTLNLTAANSPTTFTFPITIQNQNYNGNTTDIEFHVIGAVIDRVGDLHTNPSSYYAGTNATTILKYTAGMLHRVTITDNTGTMLLYDGLSAAGTLLANIDASKTVGTMEFMIPFDTGLTIVTASTPKMTVVFE